jgi:hypothetical protein
MIRRTLMTVIIMLTVFGPVGSGSAESLSIYEIQYVDINEVPDGTSPKHGEVVDCLGGIVTHKRTESTPRLFLQDPNYPNGWGAIQAKDWFGDSFDNVAVGDWVKFNNVTVEDYRGTTFLQFWEVNSDSSMPSFTIVSSNNPVPELVQVDVNEIASPVEYPNDPGCWYVTDHRAEKYESMWLRVNNVIVTWKDLGKANDNYMLESVASPNDPDFICWATDYINDDVPDGNDYHTFVETGQRFCSVTGILEQYTKISSGWDYYQLMTTYTGDLKRYSPADINGDCMVDFSDFAVLSQYWLWGTE